MTQPLVMRGANRFANIVVADEIMFDNFEIKETDTPAPILNINASGTELVEFDTAGNVGILIGDLGVSAGNLTVVGTGIIGETTNTKLRIGDVDSGSSLNAGIQNSSLSVSTGNYALKQDNLGQTQVNSVSGQDLRLNIGNSTRLLIDTVANSFTGNTFINSGNLTVGSNATINGDLTVNGTSTVFFTDNVAIQDPLIKQATNNPADLIDTGHYSLYVDAGTTKFNGLFRDASDDTFKFFTGTTVEPTTTVDITPANGFTRGDLEVGDINADSGTINLDLDVGNDLTVFGNMTMDSGDIGVSGDIQIAWNGDNVNTIKFQRADGNTNAFMGLDINSDIKFTNSSGGGGFNFTTNASGAQDVILVESLGGTKLYSLDGNGAVDMTNDLSITGNIGISGNIEPTLDAIFDLGTTGLAFRDLFLSGETIHLGDTDLSSGSGVLNINDNINTTSTEYQIGGVSKLTATTLGSAVVNSSLTNVGTLSSLTIVGNETITGDIGVSGNIQINWGGDNVNTLSFQRADGGVNASIGMDANADMKFQNSSGGGGFIMTSNSTGSQSALLVESSGGVDVFNVDANGKVIISGDLVVDTNTLVLDSTNDYIGINTTNPEVPLDVKIQSQDIERSWSPNFRTSAIFEGDAGNGTFVSIIGPSTSTSELLFGDEDVEAIGRVRYFHSDNSMRFFTANADRVNLDSSGNMSFLTGGITGDLTIEGNFTPTIDDVFDLGTTTLRFRDLFVGPGSVHIGDCKLSANATSLILDDGFDASGSINTDVGYNIDGLSKLTSTTLGSSVVNSSLTSVGTLSSLNVSGDLTVDTNTFDVDSTNNRVSIGITSGGTTELLEVRTSSGAVAQGIRADEAFIGTYGGAQGFSQFSHHTKKSGSGDYALLHSNTGDTYFNASTGKAMYFRINNTNIGTWNASELNITNGLSVSGQINSDPHFFRAIRNNTLSTTSGISKRMTFNYIDENRGSFTESGGQITVPVSGLYHISYMVYWDANSTGYRKVWIEEKTNLETRAVQQQNGMSGTATIMSCSYMANLSVANKVSIELYQTSGSNIDVGVASSTKSYLELTRIGNYV